MLKNKYIFLLFISFFFGSNQLLSITPTTLSNQFIIKEYFDCLISGVKPEFRQEFLTNTDKAYSLFLTFDKKSLSASSDLLNIKNEFTNKLAGLLNVQHRFWYSSVEHGIKAIQRLQQSLQKLSQIDRDKESVELGLTFVSFMLESILLEKHFERSILDKIRKNKWRIAAAIAVPAIAYGLTKWYDKNRAWQENPSRERRIVSNEASEKPNESQSIKLNLMPQEKVGPQGERVSSFTITTENGEYILPKEVIEQSEFLSAQFLGQLGHSTRHEPLKLDEFFKKTNQEIPSAEGLNYIFKMLNEIAKLKNAHTKLGLLKKRSKEATKPASPAKEPEENMAVSLEEEPEKEVAAAEQQPLPPIEVISIALTLLDEISVNIEKLVAVGVNVANLRSNEKEISDIKKKSIDLARLSQITNSQKKDLEENVNKLISKVEDFSRDVKKVMTENGLGPKTEKDTVAQFVATQFKKELNTPSKFIPFKTLRNMILILDRLQLSEIVSRALIKYLFSLQFPSFIKEVYFTLPEDCSQSKEIIKEEATARSQYPLLNEMLCTVKELLANKSIDSFPSGITLDLNNKGLCDLDGLTSIKDKSRVRELDLSNNALITIPANVLGGYDYLTTLNIGANHALRGPLEISSDAFKGCLLDELFLVYSKIDKMPSFLFKDQDKLSKLHIDHATINEIEHDAFNGLKALKDLNLNDSKIGTVHAFAFGGLEIESLSFNNASIKKLSPDAFNGLTKLRQLTMGGCKIKSIEPFAFRGLKVEKLSIKDGELEEILPDTFNGMDELTELDLSTCKIKYIHPHAFRGLRKLQKLVLSDNYLETLENDAFYGLDSLEYLHIENNIIKRINRYAFRGLSKLWSLNLSRNVIYQEPKYVSYNPETQQPVYENTKTKKEIEKDLTPICEKGSLGSDAFSDLPFNCYVDRKIIFASP